MKKCIAACALSAGALVVACTSTSPATNGDVIRNGNVMFIDGVHHNDKASWTEAEADALERAGKSVVNSCQAPRDALDACARIEAGCVPLPLPGAWSPCYGSGALCSEIYAEAEISERRASPPHCVCSCSAEFAAAVARDEELMRNPPP